MTAERVLIVDDDEGLLQLMALSLKRRGFEVDTAENGEDGLQKVISATPPFSVLLTDLMMPGKIDGLELLKEVRQVDHIIQVVIVTAAPDLESAITALRANGAYDYLLKPFESLSFLTSAVERAATHRRLLIEREQLQVKSQAEAGRLRALIQNTGDAILSAGPDGILQIVNPAASRLIGSDALEGTQAFEILPPSLSTLISNWRAVSGNVPAVVQITWMDGSIQMVNMTPVPEPGSDSLGWVAVLRDITHLKRMEEIKSQLLVEAASRIRIPLAQAMNALVELNILTNQNSRINEVVSRLTQIWKRVQEWGDDLNVLIRIDSGVSLQTTNINLAAILEDVHQGQAATLGQPADIHLEIDLEPRLPQVLADPELVRRLMNGLINRAVSRTEKGGTIRLSARSSGGQVWVSVSDDGPAVSDVDLPRIFEKSFVKTASGPGVTGLEMALVKTIIDRMGGQVLVGGQGKKGSSIFVCLNAAGQPEPV